MLNAYNLNARGNVSDENKMDKVDVHDARHDATVAIGLVLNNYES